MIKLGSDLNENKKTTPRVTKPLWNGTSSLCWILGFWHNWRNVKEKSLYFFYNMILFWDQDDCCRFFGFQKMIVPQEERTKVMQLSQLSSNYVDIHGNILGIFVRLFWILLQLFSLQEVVILSSWKTQER